MKICSKCGFQNPDEANFCGRCGTAYVQKNVQPYDLNSVVGIRSIRAPYYQQICGLASPTNNIEYILQRKATEHKKNGRMDLAIECLRKSNEIMPVSNFTWSATDYLRLVKYLVLDGRYEEARRELLSIQKYCKRDTDKKRYNEFCESFKHWGDAEPALFNMPSIYEQEERARYSQLLELSRNGYDLVQIDVHRPTCEECAKYQGRVFSISGRNNLFPRLPDVILKTGKIHRGCKHVVLPYVASLQTREEIRKDSINSNRPFIDNRPQDEKDLYEKQQRDFETLVSDRRNYQLLLDKVPHLAPKSFGGYRRMKASGSKNFQALKEAAKQFGIEL
jgi:tetratricopeptide (TPR) repeat protein